MLHTIDTKTYVYTFYHLSGVTPISTGTQDTGDLKGPGGNGNIIENPIKFDCFLTVLCT